MKSTKIMKKYIIGVVLLCLTVVGSLQGIETKAYNLVTVNDNWITVDTSQNYVIYGFDLMYNYGELSISLQGSLNGIYYEVSPIPPSESDYPDMEWEMSDFNVIGSAVTNTIGCTSSSYYCKLGNIQGKNIQFKVNYTRGKPSEPYVSSSSCLENNIYLYLGSNESWDRVDGWRVYIKKNGKYELYKTTGSGTCNVKNLKPETLYNFAVTNYVKDVDGSILESNQIYYSARSSTATPSATKITSVKKVGSKGSMNYYTVKWKKIKKATSYTLYGRTAKTGWKEIKTTSKTKCKIYAGKGFKYKLYVVSNRTKNGMTAISNASKVKSFKSK